MVLLCSMLTAWTVLVCGYSHWLATSKAGARKSRSRVARARRASPARPHDRKHIAGWEDYPETGGDALQRVRPRRWIEVAEQTGVAQSILSRLATISRQDDKGDAFLPSLENALALATWLNAPLESFWKQDKRDET